MHKSWLIIITLGAAIVALALVILFVPKSKPIPVIEDTTNTPVPTQTPTVEKNIRVESPTNNQTIGQPLIITGTARVFENVVSYILKDSDGKVLTSGYTMADAKDVGLFGPFSATITYPTPETEFGVIEVYWDSPKDGEPLDKTIIFVKFP